MNSFHLYFTLWLSNFFVYVFVVFSFGVFKNNRPSWLKTWNIKSAAFLAWTLISMPPAAILLVFFCR